jgi:hypothetical protein
MGGKTGGKTAGFVLHSPAKDADVPEFIFREPIQGLIDVRKRCQAVD